MTARKPEIPYDIEAIQRSVHKLPFEQFETLALDLAQTFLERPVTVTEIVKMAKALLHATDNLVLAYTPEPESEAPSDA